MNDKKLPIADLLVDCVAAIKELPKLRADYAALRESHRELLELLVWHTKDSEYINWERTRLEKAIARAEKL
jgi:hypothetical protein